MDWFKDKEFWVDLCPFLFPESRYEDAPNEVDLILSQVAKPVRSALDLCCGPGRHSIALAKRGIEVTAVDLTSHYLESARESARERGVEVEWVHADMRDFARPEAYDLALLMFTSLGFFDDQEDDRKVLRNTCGCLKPGGTLVLDQVGKEWLAERFQETASDELADGSILVRRHKIVDGWRRIRNDWILIKDGRAKTFAFTLRIYSGDELTRELLDAGFRSVDLYGNLEGGEYTTGAQRLVAIAVK
jgi:SAM-dependent methyltransferase